MPATSPNRSRGARRPSAHGYEKGGGNDGKVGYDAGKRVKGRKIHALVDSEGLPMRVVVPSAEIQDRDGAGLVLDKIRRRFPWLELISGGLPGRRPWARGGYDGRRPCFRRAAGFRSVSRPLPEPPAMTQMRR